MPNNKGVALLITILLMSLILFLSLYFLNFSVTEDKMSKGQSIGNETYYLAEAGVNEMIWRLKNNETYKNNFENDPAWTTSFTRADPFGAGSGLYEVSIVNGSRAHGEITSTGRINLAGGKTAQRVIKTTAYKALGQTGIQDSAGYADGNIDISASRVNFYNGSAHSNNEFTLNNGSIIFIDSDLRAAGNYVKSWTSTSTIEGNIYAHNYPPEASSIDMPAVDFDSTATTSYKNKADIVYESDEFEELMEDNQNLTLNNSITYVEGDVELKGAQNLTLNGLLVVERDFSIGAKNNWAGRSGPSSLTVNHATGTPSGILSGRHINFNEYTSNVNAVGVIYAADQLNITNVPVGSYVFNVVGGLVSRKLTITSSWRQINITHDNDILLDIFPPTEFSPIILIEHWEEEY
ncbi:hypothetical protein HY798_01085 [Candidatus Falkowbacteria bacterium]|nr:hypothetical protein [Candidatus Falkowbacteria bacterium]